MKNLIINTECHPGKDGKLQFFSLSRATYDDFSIEGHRTCSITLPEDDHSLGTTAYDLAIDVRGKTTIIWGYCIRAIDVKSAVLVADFYDSKKLLLKIRYPITKGITANFSWQLGNFRIPARAETVRLSIELKGKTTACTYFAPTAYFPDCC